MSRNFGEIFVNFWCLFLFFKYFFLFYVGLINIKLPFWKKNLIFFVKLLHIYVKLFQFKVCEKKLRCSRKVPCVRFGQSHVPSCHQGKVRLAYYRGGWCPSHGWPGQPICLSLPRRCKEFRKSFRHFQEALVESPERIVMLGKKTEMPLECEYFCHPLRVTLPRRIDGNFESLSGTSRKHRLKVLRGF